MSDVLFLVGYFGICGILAFCGFLMFIASDKSISILYTFLRMNRFSEPNSQWVHRAQWRIAGLLLTVMGLFMILEPLRWLLEGSSTGVAHQTPPSGEHISRWPLVILLAGTLVTGSVLATKPRSIVALSQTMMPNRIFHPERSSRAGFIAVRLIGICFVSFAIYGALVLFGIVR